MPAPEPTPVPAAGPVVTRDPFPIANASTIGAWGPVADWPIIPIHAAVLPDGRLMTFGTDQYGRQTASFNYVIWDPREGTGPDSQLVLPNELATDIFCSAQLVLASGDLLMNGGDSFAEGDAPYDNKPNQDATLFRLDSQRLEPAGTMQRPRWYATATTLPDGRIYLQGGLGGTDRAEIREDDGRYRLLTGFATNDLNENYPRNFVAPDGKIFSMAYTKMLKIDPDAKEGRGSRTELGKLDESYSPNWYTPFVMYRPGKIMIAGGDDNKVALVDINGEAPVVKSGGALYQRREWANATVLADGRVAVSGGSVSENPDLSDVAWDIELYDPATGSWTRGPAAVRARLYHSISILLPDATLLTGGGGAWAPQENLNVEIYYPPYLFSASGNPKPRPKLTAAPTAVGPAGTMIFKSPAAADIRRMTLVATGSVTHSFDMNQRFVELDFTRDGDRLIAQLPANRFETPPGFYMVFAIDSAGTPSVARIVRIATP